LARGLHPQIERAREHRTVAQIGRFAGHFGKSRPAEVRAYLIHLTQKRRLAASSIIVTILPVALNRIEVAQFLGALKSV
jgi:hypothetical protein